jgi:hypothetical protein
MFRSKWQERESEERGGGGFYTPLTQNIVVEALRLKYPGLTRKLQEVRRLREKPGYSGLPRSAPKKRSP